MLCMNASDSFGTPCDMLTPRGRDFCLAVKMPSWQGSPIVRDVVRKEAKKVNRFCLFDCSVEHVGPVMAALTDHRRRTSIWKVSR
jgi:hypothetical protein